jgi:hypothetical protein
MYYLSWYRITAKRLVTGLFICLLMLPAPVSGVVYSNSQGFSASDNQGPIFRGIGDTYADALQDSDIEYFSLSFSIYVSDEDGIGIVIGSYKEQNRSYWNNITLGLNHEFEDGWKNYIGYGPNFTLTSEYRTRVWDVKYYACDSLGNWNASSEMKYSYNLLGKLEDPFRLVPVYAILLEITVIAIIGVVFWKREYNRTSIHITIKSSGNRKKDSISLIQ